jgi:hypothetical protein
MPDRPHPLTAPQSARASIRFGSRVGLEAEVQVSPLGLLAMSGLVAAILLSIPPIIRAARERPTLPPPAP